MKIQKAIEIKEQYLQDNQPYDLEELEAADRLSIEALKRLEQYRLDGEEMRFTPLPGETLEEEIKDDKRTV